MKTKIIVSLIAVLLQVMPIHASWYYSINFDYKTIGLMSASYVALFEIENKNESYEHDVMKHYAEATGYSTAIYSEKMMMYNSLKDPGELAKENCLYYNAIYKLVSEGIIPKTISVLKLCLKDPKQALWWGTRLNTVMSETENLCHQYQSVVTNGKLKFNDIPFLKFKQEYADLVDLSIANGKDWKEQINNIFSANFESCNSEDSLEVSYKTFPTMVAKIASAGANIYSSVMDYAPYYSKFKNTISEVNSIIGNFQNIDSFESGVCNTLGALSSVAELVETSNYSEDGWINSFQEDNSESDFTQTVKIVYHDYGTDTIAWYDPPTFVDKIPTTTIKASELDEYCKQNVTANPEWYCIVSGSSCTDKSIGYDFSSSEMESMYNYSEQRAGYSRASYLADQETNKDKYTYHFYENLLTHREHRIREKDHVDIYPFKAGAAYLHCTRWHDWKTELQSFEFDSDKEDYDAFKDRVNLALQQAREKANAGKYDYQAQTYDENGKALEQIDGTKSVVNPYYGLNPENIILDWGTKNYYQHTTANQLAGATKATFKVTCHGEYDLNNGKFVHMCEHGKKSWIHQNTAGWDHCDDNVATIQECIFDNVTEIDDPTDNTIEDSIAYYKEKIETLETQRSEVLNEQKALDITVDKDKYIKLQDEYNSLSNEIDNCNSILGEYTRNKEEAEAEKYNQITELSSSSLADVMETLSRTYQIEWENAYDDPSNFVNMGDYLQYTRIGSCDSRGGSMVFTAKLSFDEPGFKAKWIKIFGAKIFMRRRARALCEYHLKAYTTEENVIEEMDVDGKSKEEAAQLVEERRKELQANYDPDSCQVTVQLAYKEQQNDSIEDVQHLMYPADRLDIAQDIYARLRKIYIELVYVERYMQYKTTWGQLIKGYFPYVRNDSGLKTSIASVCLRRWMKNGGAKGYDD